VKTRPHPHFHTKPSKQNPNELLKNRTQTNASGPSPGRRQTGCHLGQGPPSSSFACPPLIIVLPRPTKLAQSHEGLLFGGHPASARHPIIGLGLDPMWPSASHHLRTQMCPVAWNGTSMVDTDEATSRMPPTKVTLICLCKLGVSHEAIELEDTLAALAPRS
jgi:hypothetical protein